MHATSCIHALWPRRTGGRTQEVYAHGRERGMTSTRRFRSESEPVVMSSTTSTASVRASASTASASPSETYPAWSRPRLGLEAISLLSQAESRTNVRQHCQMFGYSLVPLCAFQ